MSDRAISGAAGAAYGTSRAVASARLGGVEADYRLTEADDGRLTENGLDYRILDEAITAASAGSITGAGSTAAIGAAIAAASGSAVGTSTAAAVSTAEVPPIVVLLGGGAPRVWERVVSAEGHAAGTSSCRATGRAIFAAGGKSENLSKTVAFGVARRYLHDDELMILLEAA